MSKDMTTPGLTDLNAFLQRLAKTDLLLGDKVTALEAAVKELKAKDKSLEARDDQLQKESDKQQQEIANEQKENEEQQKEIDENKEAIEAERAAREKADNELKNAIDKEKTAREAADALIIKDIEELQGEVKELKVEIKKLGGLGRIFGGNGGLPFGGSGKTITGIKIETDGSYLDSISFAIDGADFSKGYGSNKGTVQEIKCGKDEYFNKVIVRYNPDNYTYFYDNKTIETTVIGRIEFFTNMGRRIAGGKKDGAIYIEAKGKLAGVNGRSGTLVDQLQFYWRAN